MFVDSNFSTEAFRTGDFNSGDFYTGIVQSYYSRIDKKPSSAGELFSNPEITNVICDPIPTINGMLGLIKTPVKSILSVIGPNAPAFFKSKYPQAKINAFDINPNQLRTYTPEIKGNGGDVFVADIAIPGEISNLFKRVQPDIVYLSNISDYLSPDENLEFGDELIKLASTQKFNLLLTEFRHQTDIVSPQYSGNSGLRLPLWEYLYAGGLKHEFECVRNTGSSAHLLSCN